MEIKVNHYPIHKVTCYDPQGNCLGDLHETEFLDLRAQIAEQDVSGYTFKTNLPDWDEVDQKFSITPDGEIEGGNSEAIRECFSQDYELVLKIRRIQRAKEEKKSGGYPDEIPEYGTVISIEDFKKQARNGMLTIDDGHGYAAKDGKMNRKHEVYPTSVGAIVFPEGATHVVWFNK